MAEVAKHSLQIVEEEFKNICEPKNLKIEWKILCQFHPDFD